MKREEERKRKIDTRRIRRPSSMIMGKMEGRERKRK